MAGDWIKMRVGLTNHPRVLRIAECLLQDSQYLSWSGLSYGVPSFPAPDAETSRSERHAALRITRYVTVTALLKFWGYANEHAKGECIAGVWREDVDEIAGVPGFAAAIEAAGWVDFDAINGGLTMPNFEEHNTSATERNSSAAERQKRYREKKKSALEDHSATQQSDVTRDVTRDVTVTPREEKRREEKKKENTGAFSAPPDGVSDSVWQDFLRIRKAKRAPMTDTALEGIRREAEKAGLTLEKALATCCERGWQGFKADWLADTKPGRPEPPRIADTAEETRRMLAQRGAKAQPAPPEILAQIRAALPGKVH